MGRHVGVGELDFRGEALAQAHPHAVAHAFAGTLRVERGEDSTASPSGRGSRRRVGDLCKECGQATFVYEEGCKKCLSCGFNEC